MSAYRELVFAHSRADAAAIRDSLARLRGPFGEILAARRALIDVPMLEAGEIHLDPVEDEAGEP
jgi:hypothetical protein